MKALTILLCSLTAILVFGADDRHSLELSVVNQKQVDGKNVLFHKNILYTLRKIPAVEIQCKLPKNATENSPDVVYEWENVAGNKTTDFSFHEGSVTVTADNKAVQCVAKDKDKKALARWQPTKLQVFRESSDLADRNQPSVKINSIGSLKALNYSARDPKALDGYNVTLSCVCERRQCGESNKTSFNWLFNGNTLTEHDLKSIQVFDNGTLLIKNPTYFHAGVYVCVSKVSNDLLAFHNIEGPAVFTAKHSSRNVSESKMEGESVNIKVDVQGSPVPKLTWYRQVEDDSEIEEINQQFLEKYPSLAKRIRFYPTADVPNGELEIVELEKGDRAYYIAILSNEGSELHESAYFVVLVRVKGKLDALWPFLGIVAEVIILVAIIFIYERRRSKQDAELEETPEQKPLKNQPVVSQPAGDVRQRKA